MWGGRLKLDGNAAQGEAAVEVRPSRVPGAGLGLFLRHDSRAGRVVLREHCLVAKCIHSEGGVSMAWGLTLQLMLIQQATGSLPDWVAQLHINEPFASRQLQDPADKRMLMRLARGRDEAAVRRAFGIAVTNHFANAGVAWLGPLSSRFNHGPLLVANNTPVPRMVPATPELARGSVCDLAHPSASSNGYSPRTPLRMKNSPFRIATGTPSDGVRCALAGTPEARMNGLPCGGGRWRGEV